MHCKSVEVMKQLLEKGWYTRGPVTAALWARGRIPDWGSFKKKKGEGKEKLRRSLQLCVGGERKQSKRRQDSK